jgi:beta-glucosidase
MVAENKSRQIDSSFRNLKRKSQIEEMLSSMTIEEKIGQMSQIDINMIIEDDSEGNGKKRLNVAAAELYLGERGIGSVLNLVSGASWTAQDFRQVAVQLKEISDRYNRPPVIWGLDSVHGANYILGASIPPQPINMAATFNLTVPYQAGIIASRDTRAAGITWLFSPLLGIALEPRWSRVYETFGEDPTMVGLMAAQMIAGIQKPDSNPLAIPSRAAACAKHFIGYSMPRDGHDRSPSWIPTRHLYQYFVPPWQYAMKQNALTVMESYTETDGVPNVANPQALNYLLRQRLGFDGVLVTDYEEIRNANTWHHIAVNDTQATIKSLLDGSVDMSMIPWDADGFRDGILAGIQGHRLFEWRLNQSTERVLKLKETLNMYHENLAIEDPNLAMIGSDEQAVLDMAQQSLILAENDGLLPLSLNTRHKILVTGPTSSSLIHQSGGWTGQWQGALSDDWFAHGSTVFDAFSREEAWDVSFSCGVNILGGECDDEVSRQKTPFIEEIEEWVGRGPSTSIERAVKAAASKDVVLVCVGEEAYTEKPGDIRSMELPQGQYELVKALKENSVVKIVLVYFGGRPRLLRKMVEQADATIVAFLPGPTAGEALKNIVSGQINPSGKMPITYPKYSDNGGIPYFHSVSDKCTDGLAAMPHFDYVPCEVQWSFGHGLSYTSFQYSDLKSSAEDGSDLIVSVRIKNTGSTGGSEAVMLFTFDENRPTTPEYKRLRAFKKIWLASGEERTVTLTVSPEELHFIGPHNDKHYISDPAMRFWVGMGASTDCRSNPDSDLCSIVEPSVGEEAMFNNCCDVACDLWTSSQCADQYGFDQASCLALCSSISSYPTSATTLGKDGWGWNYVECLESVLWGFEQVNELPQCWKMTTLCRDVFQTKNFDEYGLGPGITPQKILPRGVTWMPNAVAVIAALISSYMMAQAMRGGFCRRTDESNERDAIQFSRVQTEQD